MECINCHTPIPDGSQFCLHCGANVSDPSGASSSALTDAGVQQMVEMLEEETGDEFRIESEIGRGGMAAVYLATEVHLHRKVAIKVLPPELTFGEGSTERFQREARTAAALDHPNIIPIHRIAPPGRKLFWYAMKFLEGRSLEEVLREKGRLDLEETVEILEPVADALDYAHERDVIHRDIKPANIMLDMRNRVVVTDFGIAKEMAAGSFTASGSVLGTPYYMSPEQCMGGEITGAADQYATAVMTYQLLSGHLPYEATSAVQLLHKHCFEQPPPLEELRPGLPNHVYRAIERGMAKKAPERFPTVSAFVEALKRPPAPGTAVAAPAPRTSAWSRVSTQAAAEVKRRPTVTIVGAATVVAAAGVFGWWWVNRTPEEGTAATQELLGGPGAIEQGQPPEAAAQSEAATEEPQPLGDTLASAPAAAVPTPGRLTVVDLPSNGRVFVNGELQQGTEVELEPGSYTVRLEASGFEAMTRTITLDAGEQARLGFAASRVTPQQPEPARQQPVQEEARPAAPPPATQGAILIVRTDGGWGRIFVDNAFRRQGSVFRTELPAGTHHIRVEREGYVTVDTLVTLTGGEETSVVLEMREGGGP